MGCGYARIGIQPSDGAKQAHPTPCSRACRGVHRSPDVGTFRKCESNRHDADNEAAGGAFDSHGATDDRRISSEGTLPERVAQNDLSAVERSPPLGHDAKPAPDDRADPQEAE